MLDLSVLLQRGNPMQGCKRAEDKVGIMYQTMSYVMKTPRTACRSRRRRKATRTTSKGYCQELICIWSQVVSWLDMVRWPAGCDLKHGRSISVQALFPKPSSHTLVALNASLGPELFAKSSITCIRVLTRRILPCLLYRSLRAMKFYKPIKACRHVVPPDNLGIPCRCSSSGC